MEMKMSNKIGFNNFKAFGPKMQYFTKKPITLIYGPNSVGKSSLLHSQIYLDYLRKAKLPTLDLLETYFAGDKLDLGGFETFKHKHDASSPLVFELDITEQEEKYKLLSLDKADLTKLKEYNFQTLDFSAEHLDEFLNQELEYKLKMSNIISLIRTELEVKKSKKLLEQYPKNSDFKSMHDSNVHLLNNSRLRRLTILKTVIFDNNYDKIYNESMDDEEYEIKNQEEKLKYDSGVYNDMALKILDEYIKK